MTVINSRVPGSSTKDRDHLLPFMRAPQGEQPIELKSLDIKVLVCGQFARTTQTMRFSNPNRRNLEGELIFPLPDNATVCGYALDIDGELVDGVIVPKQQARMILEMEIRKGVDPGLIEQVQGNVYKTRVYPIPPHGSRTVQISYTSELVTSGCSAAYHLPLGHAEELAAVSLRVEVSQTPVKPEISGGQGTLNLTSWQNRWMAEATLARGVACADLQIRLPNLPESFTMLETTSLGETFFCVSRQLPTVTGAKPWRAKRIAIAWDASGSRTAIDRDLAFLEELFTTWQELTVDLQVFADTLTGNRIFTIKKGNASELFAYLRKLPCDGATDISAIDFSTTPHPDDEAWLLFSDGLATLNQGLPRLGLVKVHAVSSQTASDAGFLQYLAEETGGTFCNLLHTSPESAAKGLLAGTTPCPVVESEGCADIVVKQTGGRLLLSGRLLAAGGSLQENTYGTKVHLDRAQAAAGEILAGRWAGAQLHKLALLPDSRPDELLALARKYGVVSPQTSLLVLETIDQYLEYSIEPPATRPALLAEYHYHRQESAKAEEEFAADHLEEVVRLWRQRVTWWQTEFKLEPPESGVVYGRNQENPRSASRGNIMSSSTAPSRQPIDEMNFYMQSDDDNISYCLDSSDSSPMQAPSAVSESIERMLGLAPPATTLKPWSPDTPYLTALKNSEGEEAYAVYLGQRTEYAMSPAFFFDCGDYFLAKQEKQTGLKILSNLLEMNLEDVALMRMYAWRLQQAEELDRAIAVFRRILDLRDDEPQSWRDLALALADRWERENFTKDAEEAMNLLYQVVFNEWYRFPEIELIALMELNRLIHLAGQAGIDVPAHFDRRLIKPLDLDIRISMAWDADLTDIDLHVYEPTGEHACYSHKKTAIGGLVSRDFRDGYGPEEYVLRRAASGTYQIRAHYFGSHQQRLCGPCTVMVQVFTDYCRPEEKKQTLSLRLDQGGADFLVGEVTIDGGKANDKISPDQGLLAKAGRLKRGMSVVDIANRLGPPQRMEHGESPESILLVYPLADRTEIRITMAPDLVSVRRVMDGAEVDMFCFS